MLITAHNIYYILIAIACSHICVRAQHGFLPLGFPSPKMTTLSLGGEEAPGWFKLGKK